MDRLHRRDHLDTFLRPRPYPVCLKNTEKMELYCPSFCAPGLNIVANRGPGFSGLKDVRGRLLGVLLRRCLGL